METAIERWQEMLQARAGQMDAAYASLGRSSADFWDRRARGFHRATRENVDHDPFYLYLREHITAQDSVLDVGAGTGRFSLALAAVARQVTALEPNASMLSYLEGDIRASGLSNITTLQQSWEDAPAQVRADIVICSHVLYPIFALEPFVRKLDRASERACYLYLRGTHIDSLTAPLWRHFHKDERHVSPGYIQVLDVLYEMGIYADVSIVRAPFALVYPTMQDAEDELIEQLILPDNDSTRRELRGLLGDWLRERPDGIWSSPEQEMISAILWWGRA